MIVGYYFQSRQKIWSTLQMICNILQWSYQDLRWFYQYSFNFSSSFGFSFSLFSTSVSTPVPISDPVRFSVPLNDPLQFWFQLQFSVNFGVNSSSSFRLSSVSVLVQRYIPVLVSAPVKFRTSVSTSVPEQILFSFCSSSKTNFSLVSAPFQFQLQAQLTTTPSYSTANLPTYGPTNQPANDQAT